MPSVGGYTSNMFLFLLSLVALAKITHQTQAQSPSPSPSPSPSSTSKPTFNNQYLVTMLNDFRSAIAKGQAKDKNLTDFPQSSKMFKLTANRDLAERAQLLTMQCFRNRVIPPPAPYSFAWYLGIETDKTRLAKAALYAWFQEGASMPKNASYSASYEYFGSLVYHKSTLAGCAVSWEPCEAKNSYVFACVFNNRPVIGQPLYPAKVAAKPGPGCSANSCPKVAGTQSTCETGLGLCSVAKDVTFKPNTAATTKPTTSASTTASGATTKPSTAGTAATTGATVADGVITKEMADNIVLMHNKGRMMAAKGPVPNGKSGKNLPQGANINMLKYDWGLGNLAQDAAKKCPTSTAASINNYDYGENVYISNTVSTPYSDLIESAIGQWFNEIYSNGMNMKMNFTDFLATKPNPPTHFTQMVWATHKMVGCGAHRCGYYTVVVCRYKPGGNIIGQYVYKVGAPCSACGFGCNAQFLLCNVPLRS